MPITGQAYPPGGSLDSFMHSPLTVFLENVRRDIALWQSVDVRVMAARIEGVWHNLYTYARLRGEAPARVRLLPHLLKTDMLRCEQFVLPIEALPSFLDGVETGAWPRENPVEYLAGQFGLGSTEAYEFRHGQFYQVGQFHERPEIEWAAHVLTAGGESTGTIVGRIPGGYTHLQTLIQQQPYPFQTMEHQVRHVLGDAPHSFGSGNCFCRVVAPYEVRIEADSVHLSDGTASVTVVAESRGAAERARLQLTTEPARDEIPENSLLPPVHTWVTEAEGPWRWAHQFQVGDAGAVSFILHCGAQSLQWERRNAFRVGGRSVPLLVSETLDPDLEVLRQSLSGESGKSGRQAQFEEAVARLLTLGGFLVDRFSEKKLSDGIDLVAFAPDVLLCLAVECTTHAISASGKMSKLVGRASYLREAVAPMSLLAIAVTSLSADGVAASDWENARRSGVSVITREVLLEMVTLVRQGSGVSAFLELIRQKGLRVLESAY
jgi:hypothetical protein